MRKERRINRVDNAISGVTGVLGAFLLFYVEQFIMVIVGSYTSDRDSMLRSADCMAYSLLGAAITAVVSLILISYKNRLEKLLEKLPDPLEEAIDADCGDTLDEAMEYLRDQRLEYRVMCRTDGSVITAGTMLNPRECNISEEGGKKVLDCGSDWIDLHNHPILSEEPFSKQDFASFIKFSHGIEDIVVTSHYTYRLKKTKDVSNRVEEFEQYLETLPGFETCYTGFNGRRKHIKLIQQIADRYEFEFTIEDLRRDLAEKWLRRNRRRLCAVASCAILALRIFYNPVTIPSDAAVAVSTKDIAHVDPDYTADAAMSAPEEVVFFKKDRACGFY